MWLGNSKSSLAPHEKGREDRYIDENNENRGQESLSELRTAPS
jgi:hypothetical protein